MGQIGHPCPVFPLKSRNWEPEIIARLFRTALSRYFEEPLLPCKKTAMAHSPVIHFNEGAFQRSILIHRSTLYAPISTPYTYTIFTA